MTAATHHSSDSVRAAAVSNKYKVMTLLLYPDHNATKLTFHLQGYRNGEQDTFQVSVIAGVSFLVLVFAEVLFLLLLRCLFSCCLLCE